MRSSLLVAAFAALVCGAVDSSPALARDTYYDHHRDDRHHSDYRHKCGGGNGAVGTIAGGVGGAVIGNAVGGGTAGTVLGGVGGALLGRHLDKKNTRARNHC